VLLELLQQKLVAISIQVLSGLDSNESDVMLTLYLFETNVRFVAYYFSISDLSVVKCVDDALFLFIS
jgi:hypothetical protein